MILRRPFRVPLLLILLPLCLASVEARAERKVKEEAKPNQSLVSPTAKPMITGGKTLNTVIDFVLSCGHQQSCSDALEQESYNFGSVRQKYVSS